MDPLSDVLSLLRPHVYVTGALSAGAPWSLQLPAYRGMKCYMVVKGECQLSVEGVEQPFTLREGGCLLLPHGRPFVIASDLSLPPVGARTVVSKVERYNGVLTVSPGEDFLALGSHFDLGNDASFLLDVLPPVVFVEDETQQELTRWAVKRILHEMRNPLPGGTLVAQQVAYTILIDALRLHLATQKQLGPGWLSALADKRMRTALSRIHEEPARAWTLEELARLAGMSRTAFAQTFKRSVGETPMAYLTRWRMTLAASRMRDERETISSVASSVGYQSESAFCAAFKRQLGSSPRQYLHGGRSQRFCRDSADQANLFDIVRNPYIISE